MAYMGNVKTGVEVFKLSSDQKKEIKELYEAGNSISSIACKMGLMRSYVQDLIKDINKG